MSGTDRPSGAPLASILFDRIKQELFARLLRIKVRPSANVIPRRSTEMVLHWVFYIGLGDQFDDDRRRIRTAEPGPKVRNHHDFRLNQPARQTAMGRPRGFVRGRVVPLFCSG